MFTVSTAARDSRLGFRDEAFTQYFQTRVWHEYYYTYLYEWRTHKRLLPGAQQAVIQQFCDNCITEVEARRLGNLQQPDFYGELQAVWDELYMGGAVPHPRAEEALALVWIAVKMLQLALGSPGPEARPGGALPVPEDAGQAAAC